VPSGIRQEFELKDCHRDCSDCHLDQDFKNSSGNNNLSCSQDENNPKTDNTGKGEKDFKNQQNQGYNSAKNSSGNNSVGVVIGGVAAVSFIFLSTILVLKRKRGKK